MMTNPNRLTLKFFISARASNCTSAGFLNGVASPRRILSRVCGLPQSAFGSRRFSGTAAVDRRVPREARLDRLGEIARQHLRHVVADEGADDVRMSARSMPPRILAPLKKSVGSNVSPMTLASAFSICSGSEGSAGGFAATGPMVLDSPGWPSAAPRARRARRFSPRLAIRRTPADGPDRRVAGTACPCSSTHPARRTGGACRRRDTSPSRPRSAGSGASAPA